MEELVWNFNIFGLEVGWRKYMPKEFFTYWSTYNLLYIGKLRFWNKRKYYKNKDE